MGLGKKIDFIDWLQNEINNNLDIDDLAVNFCHLGTSHIFIFVLVFVFVFIFVFVMANR